MIKWNLMFRATPLCWEVSESVIFCWLRHERNRKYFLTHPGAFKERWCGFSSTFCCCVRHSLTKFHFNRGFKVLTTDYEHAQTLRNTMDDQMQIILFQKFVDNTRLLCFYVLFLCIYTFILTVLMLNKFTYSHEHTFNLRDQDYDWKSSILCSQSKSRTVACKPTTQF